MENAERSKKFNKGMGYKGVAQSEFLEFLRKTNGNKAYACKLAGIDRKTYYNWRESDSRFADDCDRVMENEKQTMNDFAESKLFQQIKRGNVTSIIYYLKTQHPEYKLRVERVVTIKEESLPLSRAAKVMLQEALDFVRMR